MRAPEQPVAPDSRRTVTTRNRIALYRGKEAMLRPDSDRCERHGKAWPAVNTQAEEAGRRRRCREASASSTRSEAKSCAVNNTSSRLASNHAARKWPAASGRNRSVRGAPGASDSEPVGSGARDRTAAGAGAGVVGRAGDAAGGCTGAGAGGAGAATTTGARVAEPASDNMPITTSDVFLPMVSPSLAAALIDTLHHIHGERGICLGQVRIGLGVAKHEPPADHPLGRGALGDQSIEHRQVVLV